METRKVQTVGGGVSLPKEWTRSAGVDTGSIVELHIAELGLQELVRDGQMDRPVGRV